MRPVTRGAQGTYPYNIDMSSQAQMQATLANYNQMEYRAAAVLAYFSNNNYPTMWQQLFAWLTLTRSALGEIVLTPPQSQNLAGAVSTIVDRNGPQYRLAANPLIDNLGRACAYCEKPNPSPLSVEHMVPKDNYPLFAVSWDNFLLGCAVCNTAGTGKGTGPGRATVRGWSPNPIVDEIDYYTRCRAYYQWPDNVDAYRSMPPRLEYRGYTDGLWRPVPPSLSVRSGIAITSKVYSTRTIMADIYLDQHRYNREVRVSYAPTTNVAVNAITYFGLDQRGGGGANPTTSDGRQYDRTRAWFSIVHLAVQYPGSTSPWFQSWFDTMLELAEDVGNFSVWVSVLALLNYTDEFGRSFLGYFLSRSTQAGGPFPGTNVWHIP